MSKKKKGSRKSNTEIYYQEQEEEFAETKNEEKFYSKPLKKEDKEDKESPVSEFYKKTFSKTSQEEIMREYAERVFLKKAEAENGTNT